MEWGHIVEHCDSVWINEKTRVLKPVFTGDYQTEIVTESGSYFSKKSCLELLQLVCLRYFSDYEGRIKAARHYLKYDRKTPVYLGDANFSCFPTRSPKHPECMWIFNQEYSIYAYDLANKKTVLLYADAATIEVNASRHTLEKQLNRTIMMVYRARNLERS
ncbi:competence protein ComK [Paenisporosarcina cavernae]|uniref:Competence protein n=1 Tax=Paenisporosarcina cavernae TaxID=2320858 RepID=A0A385YQW3_9BACL|nr:competence protein ComK [Paenisporosarcina cavernae]AYC28871.1 hypothetical protein D3873_02915 [Paenisporosarcina cavernae]